MHEFAIRQRIEGRTAELPLPNGAGVRGFEPIDKL
jgi:hypothetical protein